MPHPEPFRRTIALLCLISIASAFGGCRDRQIRSYQTPKEADDSSATAPASEAVPPVVTEPAAPQWLAPADWQAQPISGMRLASFTVTDGKGGTADVSVVNFGGTGGDELANINRWRGQLKLAPVGADALASQVESLGTAAGDFSVADLTAEQAEPGKPPSRILGAWLQRGGKVWFFKMMGPAELVGSQKPAFLGFLKSVTFAAAPQGGPVSAGPRSQGIANTNDLPRTAPAAPDLSLQAPSPSVPGVGPVKAAEGSLLVWHAPDSWTVRKASSMRKGSYALGPEGSVDLAITAFPGDVGGPLANVNRWLGQVGLPPIEEAALGDYTTHMAANGLEFFIADTGAKDPTHPQRIVAGVVFWQGNSWFFKMTGPAEQVGREKPGFLEFLQTVHAP